MLETPRIMWASARRKCEGGIEGVSANPLRDFARRDHAEVDNIALLVRQVVRVEDPPPDERSMVD